ncbi:hypothetical protein [Streptomyces cellostaticus]|uniref:hypothetical protein n=1 Tax=Streptomyces cellostaticus TaxID=67285 RepID=UPI002025C733|nr:hypothetical protein [Streptomyces cellostaticus]
MNTERPENPEDPRDPAEPEVSGPGTAGTGEAADGAAGEARAAAAQDSAEAPDRDDAGGAGAARAEAGEATGGVGRVADGDGDGGEWARRSRSRAVIVSVAAAVLLVGGGSAYLAAAGGGSGSRAEAGASGGGATPSPLHLDGWTRGGTGGIAPGEPNPYGARYVAVGELPDGPGSAPVYLPGDEVGRDRVARLAKALGVDGAPVAEGRGWRVGGKDGSGPVLRVNRDAPGDWTYSRYAPGTDNCRKVAVCAHDPAAPAADPVSVADAEKAAAPVLKALGLDDARIDASTVMGAQRVVDADPVVGGLPTDGLTTGLTVDAKGELAGGHGQLAAPVRGDTYPVLGAARTLELMNEEPRSTHRMGIGGCASPVPLKDRDEQPCGASTSVPKAADEMKVEKAVFGLAARSSDGRQVLVPAWLFEVRGPAADGDFTVAYPAVDPEYLVARSAATAPDAPSPTRGAASAGPGARHRSVPADGYSAHGRELRVSFTGGMCSDYRAAAKESAGRVTVTVTESSRPGEMCVAMGKLYTETVRLDAPLDGRAVVGDDGRRLPAAKRAEPRPQASR